METPEIKPAEGPARDAKGRIMRGHSGNPGGRPAAVIDARKLWERILGEKCDNGSGLSNRDALLRKYLSIAIRDGEPSILRDAINRILGKVPDVVDSEFTVHIDRGPKWSPIPPKSEP